MTTRVYRILLVAALVTIAGCVGAGGLGGEMDSEPEQETNGTESDGTTGVAGETESGALTFYVSDEPNRIDDFEHLNVTVTKVGLEATGGPSDEGADDAENETESENATESDDATEGDDTTEDGDRDEDGDENGNGDWIEYTVDDRTVDLTELQGANASALDVLEVPEGEYETVFIYVSDTEGILTDGTETRVKLPSEKLKIQTPFTVEAGAELDFVFDIAPHEAGKSGKYILKPVIGQSGTGDEIEIRDVDDPADDTETETDADDSSDRNGDEADESRTDGPEAESDTADENGDERVQHIALATVG